VILAMGDTSELIGAETPAVVSGPSFAQTSQGDKVGFVDGMAMARVAALLRAHGSGFEIRRAGSLTLQDMRRAPAVLIGEMNNPWAKLVEGAMRYRFVWDQAASMVTLQDRQHPEQALWQLNWNTPYAWTQGGSGDHFAGGRSPHGERHSGPGGMREGRDGGGERVRDRAEISRGAGGPVAARLEPQKLAGRPCVRPD